MLSLVLGTRKVEVKTTVSLFRNAHGLVGEAGSEMNNSIKGHRGVSANPIWGEEKSEKASWKR